MAVMVSASSLMEGRSFLQTCAEFEGYSIDLSVRSRHII